MKKGIIKGELMQSESLKRPEKAQQKSDSQQSQLLGQAFNRIQVLKPTASAKAKDENDFFSTSGCRPAGV